MARSKQEQNRQTQPALANHYRAIGPAAIVAALLHTAKKKKPAQKIVSPRAAWKGTTGTVPDDGDAGDEGAEERPGDEGPKAAFRGKQPSLK